MTLKPRPYQLEDLQKIEAKLFAGVTRQLVQYATGLGKTPLFSALRNHLKSQKRKMVISHTDELVQQAADKLKKWNPGVPVGIEKAEFRSDGEPIVSASVQTIGRAGSPRLTQFNPMDFDVLVIDEAHHATAQSYQTIINHFTQNPALLVLGVTATVNRADGKGLGEVFQEIVANRDVLFGVRNGWLAEPRGRVIRTRVKLDEVKTQAGDFEQESLSRTINTQSRNEQVVLSWIQHAENRQSVFFASNVQHAKDLAETFRIAGVQFHAIWGDDPDRKDKLALHRAGKIKGLVNAQLLTEGYDDWHVSCIGLASPTQSESRYIQRVGRGTRIPDNIENILTAKAAGQIVSKDDCLVLDYVDSSSKHSLVTLPSLYGLNEGLDMKGRKLVQVLDEVEKLKSEHVGVDLTKVEDVTKLESYAVEVDLFKVQFPPEVIQISKYQWHRTGDNAYVLLLKGGESVTVIKDLLDKWHIIGTVNENPLRDSKPTFEEAIREADFKVRIFGGRDADSAAKRVLSKDGEKPSPAQLILCKRLGIQVPPGATFGDVRRKLSQVVLKLRQQRLRRVG